MTMRFLYSSGLTIGLLGLLLLLATGCSSDYPEAAVAADVPALTATGSDASTEAPGDRDTPATAEPTASIVTPDPPDPTRTLADASTLITPTATSVEPAKTPTVVPSVTARRAPAASPIPPPVRPSSTVAPVNTPTSRPAATAPPSPTVPPPASSDRSGWRLAFGDEFAGSRLDESKWQSRLGWGTGVTNPPEAQYYVPDSLEVRDGRLRIRAEKRTVGGFGYTSGVISSHPSFSFTYGYVEARVRVPTGKGLWSAFWLTSVLPRSWQEIDVMEVIGSEPDRLYVSLHWLDPARGHQYRTVPQTGIDLTEGFLTLGVDWSPSAVVWYVDGVERFRMTEHVPTEPMYVIANLAVGGTWPGYPDGSTRFPADLLIDYVRVYQR